MPYTYAEITPYYNGSEVSLKRKVYQLKKEKKFEKKGKLFTEKECMKLAKLLEFTFIPHNGNGNGKH